MSDPFYGQTVECSIDIYVNRTTPSADLYIQCTLIQGGFCVKSERIHITSVFCEFLSCEYVKSFIKSCIFDSTDSAGTLKFLNNKNILHLMEGQSFTINYSNTLYGYPVPEVSIRLDNYKSSVSRCEVRATTTTVQSLQHL